MTNLLFIITYIRKKNTWRVYDRVYACLKKCGDFDDPWTVDSYQDCSCRSGHRYKKLAIITAKPPRTSCSSNYTSRYIRDERKYKVNTGKINIDHGDELGDVSVVINTQYIFTGSHNYPINKEVVWQFRIPSGKVAMVHFERSQFQLDQSSDDYVSISNSPAGGYKKILRGGDILEHTYVFSGKTLTIKFVSDEIGTSTGFEALIVFH